MGRSLESWSSKSAWDDIMRLQFKQNITPEIKNSTSIFLPPALSLLKYIHPLVRATLLKTPVALFVFRRKYNTLPALKGICYWVTTVPGPITL